MSVMLTKFESKSNRVKGMFSLLLRGIPLMHVLQDWHFILHSLYLQQLCIMVVFSYGIIAWAYWSTDLKNMKVGVTQNCDVSWMIYRILRSC